MADHVDGTRPPLGGVWPALVTPLSSDSSAVDERTLRDHVDACVDAGVSGLVVCGGTGEANYLSPEERQVVAEVVADQVAGRTGLIVHAGGVATREAVRLARHALGLGASAVMVGLPGGDPLDYGQSRAYFAAVSDAAGLPLVAYNYPSGTGVNMDADFLGRLVDDVPAVSYLKDSGTSLIQQYDVIKRFGPRLPVFAGYDWQAAPALAMGAAGLISGGMNVFPATFARLYAAARAGDAAAANTEWLSLLPMARFLETHPFVSSVKHACRMMGRDVGPVRPPGAQLDPAGIELLARVLGTS